MKGGIMENKIYTKDDLPKDLLNEVIEELLSTGYGENEFGYRVFDGGVVTSIYCRMPNCTGEMLNWWFGTYLCDTPAYKLWSPDHESLRWENKNEGEFIGAIEVNEEFGVTRRSHFLDPAEVFETSRFKELNINHAQYVLVEHTGVPGRGTVNLTVCRDTEYGCEYRARYFQIGGTIEGAKRNLKHSIDENSDLATFLPILYSRRNR